MDEKKPTGDDLAVTPVLVQDERMLREMLFDRLYVSAGRVRETLEDQKYTVSRGEIRVRPERELRGQVEDLQRCVDLLGQIGWR